MKGNQLLREHWKRVGPAGREAIVNMNIAALNPSTFREALLKSGQALLSFRIILAKGDQRADAPCRACLSACRERPCCCSTDYRNEVAPSHVLAHNLEPASYRVKAAGWKWLDRSSAMSALGH